MGHHFDLRSMTVLDFAGAGLWLTCKAENLESRGAMLSRVADNDSEQSGKIAKACPAPRQASR